MEEIKDVRRVTDIRGSNMFRDGSGDAEHLSTLNFRNYNRTDLVILVLVVVVTVVVNKYILTKR